MYMCTSPMSGAVATPRLRPKRPEGHLSCRRLLILSLKIAARCFQTTSARESLVGFPWRPCGRGSVSNSFRMHCSRARQYRRTTGCVYATFDVLLTTESESYFGLRIQPWGSLNIYFVRPVFCTAQELRRYDG
jgi:hypothetical protein